MREDIKPTNCCIPITSHTIEKINDRAQHQNQH